MISYQERKTAMGALVRTCFHIISDALAMHALHPSCHGSTMLGANGIEIYTLVKSNFHRLADETLRPGQVQPCTHLCVDQINTQAIEQHGNCRCRPDVTTCNLRQFTYAKDIGRLEKRRTNDLHLIAQGLHPFIFKSEQMPVSIPIYGETCVNWPTLYALNEH